MNVGFGSHKTGKARLLDIDNKDIRRPEWLTIPAAAVAEMARSGSIELPEPSIRRDPGRQINRRKVAQNLRRAIAEIPDEDPEPCNLAECTELMPRAIAYEHKRRAQYSQGKKCIKCRNPVKDSSDSEYCHTCQSGISWRKKRRKKKVEKVCGRCGVSIPTESRSPYCIPCRAIRKKEQVYEAGKTCQVCGKKLKSSNISGRCQVCRFIREVGDE